MLPIRVKKPVKSRRTQFPTHSTFLQSGQAVSRTLIILAIVVLLAAIVVYAVTKFANHPSVSTQPPPSNQPAAPVYDTQVGDIRFVMESSNDLGNTIRPKTAYGSDLTTTERFIEVIVGAQDKGKLDTQSYAWDVGNIVDSEGRNFISINDRAYDFLPKPDECGSVLKPEFDPVPCVKLYEVSKKSSGLKIEVFSSSGTASRKLRALLDLR